jgi:hypothetical protein
MLVLWTTVTSLSHPSMKVHKDVIVCPLQIEDVDRCAHEFLFPWTTASASLEKWQRYHCEQEEGLRAVYLLKKDGRIIGYGSLLRVSEYPCFSDLDL